MHISDLAHVAGMGFKMTSLIVAVAQRVPEVFTGRRDVYPAKWYSKNGRGGYSPVCMDDWKKGICLKTIRCDEGKSPAGACKACKIRRWRALDHFALVPHLQGAKTAGFYLLRPDGKVKVGAVDLDDKEGTAPPEAAPMILGARLVDAGADIGLPLFLEKSGGGLGAHVWIFLEEWTEAAKVRELLHGLIKAAGLHGLLNAAGINPNKAIEVFPKQDILGADGLGSLIALPFQGPAAMSEGRSMFYDADTLMPLVVPGNFPAMLKQVYRLLKTMKAGRVQPAEFDQAHARLREEGHITPKDKKRPMAKVKVKGVESTGGDSETSETSGTFLKKPVEAIFKRCAALRKIRGVDKEGRDGVARHGLTHLERLFLAAVLRGLPGGVEAIHDVLRRCADYSPETTDYHIESLSYGAWRCATAQKDGIRVCAFTGQCPELKKRGGKSPVAFAYRARPTKPQRGVEWRPLDGNSESTEELEKKVQNILKHTGRG